LIHPSGNPSLKIKKVSGVVGGWVICLHEKLQIDPIKLFRFRPIHLVYFLHLDNKRKGMELFCAQKEAKKWKVKKT
jgi:hypothetical protein